MSDLPCPKCGVNTKFHRPDYPIRVAHDPLDCAEIARLRANLEEAEAEAEATLWKGAVESRNDMIEVRNAKIERLRTEVDRARKAERDWTIVATDCCEDRERLQTENEQMKADIREAQEMIGLDNGVDVMFGPKELVEYLLTKLKDV